MPGKDRFLNFYKKLGKNVFCRGKSLFLCKVKN
jgi:hypothetical protein